MRGGDGKPLRTEDTRLQQRCIRAAIGVDHNPERMGLHHRIGIGLNDDHPMPDVVEVLRDLAPQSSEAHDNVVVAKQVEHVPPPPCCQLT